MKPALLCYEKWKNYWKKNENKNLYWSVAFAKVNSKQFIWLINISFSDLLLCVWANVMNVNCDLQIHRKKGLLCIHHSSIHTSPCASAYIYCPEKLLCEVKHQLNVFFHYHFHSSIPYDVCFQIKFCYQFCIWNVPM